MIEHLYNLVGRLNVAGHHDLAVKLDCLADRVEGRNPKQVRRDRADQAEEHIQRLREDLHKADDPANRERILDELGGWRDQLNRYGPSVEPVIEITPVNPIVRDHVGDGDTVTKAGVPTVQQTHEKAAESLPLLPNEVRSLMTSLHGLETKGDTLVRSKVHTKRAERLWLLLHGLKGKAWGIGKVESSKPETIVYDSDAGSMALIAPTKKGQPWFANYTSQTRGVWG